MIEWVKKFGRYWQVLLHDIDGFPSSKRLGFVLSMAVLVGSWFANVLWHVIVDGHILDMAAALGGVSGAGIAGERFGKLLPNQGPEPVKPVPSNLKND